MAFRRRRFAERRRAVGHSQEQLAEQLGVERSTVVRWERGETEPQPWIRPKIAQALGISLEALDELLAEAYAEEHMAYARRRHPATGRFDANVYADAIQAFRTADRQVGGGHLYASVLHSLQCEVEPRIFGEAGGPQSAALVTAAAALSDMAGWMAHDAGNDARAEHHLERAWAFVRMGAESQLGAQIDASRSHLEDHLQRPGKAIRLARRGREALRQGAPHPALEARLLALEARGLAAFEDTRECSRMLVRAENVLGGAPGEEPSPWFSRFDEAALASETARCMCRLGHLPEARRQAERILALRPISRTRSRALGQIILATVLIAEGETEEACEVAREAMESTQSLGSRQVVHQLLALQPLLAAHLGNSRVAAFLECLAEALDRRRWLSQWPCTSHQGVAGVSWQGS